MGDLDKSSLLYFITTDRRSFPIKIGKTTHKNISGRFTSLQTALPWPLRIMLVVECEPTFEREVHHMSKGEHLRGEWYVPTIESIKDIEDIADQFPDWVDLVPAWFRKNIGRAVQ